MIAHRGKRQPMGDIARVVSYEPIEVIPKLTALTIANAECENDIEKRPNVFDEISLSRFDPILVKP
jgi:hypothetical protein